MIIGNSAGFVVSIPFFHPKNHNHLQWISIPAMLILVIYIRHLWRKGDTSKETTFANICPRDLAKMLIIFISLGIITGILWCQSVALNP